jgi:histidine triad (HIT) family protein
MTIQGCLLCDVVSGARKLPIVLETDRISAIGASIEALSAGHCVVFPKRHASSLHEVDDADLAEILPAIKRVARAMGIGSYNVLQNNGAVAGQTVFHAHVHLIPKSSAEDGLRRMVDTHRHVDHGVIFETIRARLG